MWLFLWWRVGWLGRVFCTWWSPFFEYFRGDVSMDDCRVNTLFFDDDVVYCGGLS